MLSDRAMSTRGVGKPVDELDSLCKLYKECFKKPEQVSRGDVRLPSCKDFGSKWNGKIMGWLVTAWLQIVKPHAVGISYFK